MFAGFAVHKSCTVFPFRVATSLAYFISELLYVPEGRLNNAQTVPLYVVTLPTIEPKAKGVEFGAVPVSLADRASSKTTGEGSEKESSGEEEKCARGASTGKDIGNKVEKERTILLSGHSRKHRLNCSDEDEEGMDLHQARKKKAKSPSHQDTPQLSDHPLLSKVMRIVSLPFSTR